MKILHLTLKKKWFDMIKAGIKKEEYREIKPYWIDRLTTRDEFIGLEGRHFNHFDIVQFKNGYGKDAPTIQVECKNIHINFPCQFNTEWYDEGDEHTEFFIIELGNVLPPT